MTQQHNPNIDPEILDSEAEDIKVAIHEGKIDEEEVKEDLKNEVLEGDNTKALDKAAELGLDIDEEVSQR